MRLAIWIAYAVTVIGGALWGGVSARALPVSLGARELPLEASIVDSPEPLAWMARQAVVQGLTRLSSARSLGFQLAVAKSFSVSADGLSWSFGIDPAAVFQNGMRVTASDVAFSLERCRQRGELPSVVSVSPTVVFNEDERRDSVELRLVEGGDAARQLPKVLAACPILEKASSELFRAYLGRSTAVVGTGAYQLTEHRVGREIVLTRVLSDPDGSMGPEQISLRGFSQPLQALTALRSGTLDAFLTDDGEVLSRAGKDPTLSVLACRAYNVVVRKGLAFVCAPELEVSRLRYLQ